MSVYVFRSLPYVELVGQKTEELEKKKKRFKSTIFICTGGGVKAIPKGKRRKSQGNT